MTGCQSNLLLDGQALSKEAEKKTHQVTNSKGEEKNLVVKLTTDEEEENLQYLERMKEETGVVPIGLKD